jgi:hypothetical protein
LGNIQKNSIGIIREKDLHRISNGKSRYNKLLSYLCHVNYDDNYYFKKKLMRKNEFIKCDICMERLKIDELTMYSPIYNISGHLNHVIEFISNIHKFKDQLSRNKN